MVDDYDDIQSPPTTDWGVPLEQIEVYEQNWWNEAAKRDAERRRQGGTWAKINDFVHYASPKLKTVVSNIAQSAPQQNNGFNHNMVMPNAQMRTGNSNLAIPLKFRK